MRPALRVSKRTRITVFLAHVVFPDAVDDRVNIIMQRVGRS